MEISRVALLSPACSSLYLLYQNCSSTKRKIMTLGFHKTKDQKLNFFICICLQNIKKSLYASLRTVKTSINAMALDGY